MTRQIGHLVSTGSKQSSLLDVVEKTEDANEQVDKVEIQRNRTHDKLVWAEFLGNDVRLIK